MISRADVEHHIEEKIAEGNRKFNAQASVDTIQYIPKLTVDGKSTYGTAGFDTNDAGEKVWALKFSLEVFTFDPQFLLDEVVPHEVAHLVAMWLYVNGNKKAGELGHGVKWQKIAKALGSSGKESVDFLYKLQSGDTIALPINQHYDVTKKGHNLRTKHGERITAAMYQGPNI
jgi:predicted SprT family Zn-dependent metalloprotease